MECSANLKTFVGDRGRGNFPLMDDNAFSKSVFKVNLCYLFIFVFSMYLSLLQYSLKMDTFVTFPSPLSFT